METVNSTVTSYSFVAAEYYDPRRHPTCANFRECSAVILRAWFNEFLIPGSRIVETGTGASLAAELLQNLNLPAVLVISDLSEAMLTHSKFHVADLRLISDAERLSVRDSSVDAIVSSLGDPYNTLTFWKECARVLKPGGRVFFTTPSFKWACAFREETGTPATVAEFEIKTGDTVLVPSFILSPTAQATLIVTSQLQIQQQIHIDSSAIRSTTKSPKLRSGPIVSGYLAGLPAS